jgi:hypothetical protein
VAEANRRHAGSPSVGILFAERWMPIDVRLVGRVGQQLPQIQAQPDVVTPDAAGGAARLYDASVRDLRLGMRRYVDDAAALKREVVRHAP